MSKYIKRKRGEVMKNRSRTKKVLKDNPRLQRPCAIYRWLYKADPNELCRALHFTEVAEALEPLRAAHLSTPQRLELRNGRVVCTAGGDVATEFKRLTTSAALFDLLLKQRDWEARYELLVRTQMGFLLLSMNRAQADRL